MISNVSNHVNETYYNKCNNKLNNEKETEIFGKKSNNVEQNNSKQTEQDDPILNLYKSICMKYPDVSFRLDDQKATLQYEQTYGTDCCPYFGYNNSDNQVGENFGKLSQKSVVIDASVIEKCLQDPSYQQNFMNELDTHIKEYSKDLQRAAEFGATNMCIGFVDEGKGLSKYAINAHTEFSTEEQIKAKWKLGGNQGVLINKIGDVKNEMLDNYMKILSEHSQELKDNLLNNNLDEGDN